eukprot:3896249-Pyramimonas_sp.AAC.1
MFLVRPRARRALGVPIVELPWPRPAKVGPEMPELLGTVLGGPRAPQERPKEAPNCWHAPRPQ